MLRLVMVFVILLGFYVQASAETQFYRWTNEKDMGSGLKSILERLNKESNLKLKESDFIEKENTQLSNYQFKTYFQVFSGIPVEGAMIRTWTSLKDGSLVQMEAHIEDLRSRQGRILALQNRGHSIIDYKNYVLNLDTMKYVNQVVFQSSDRMIRKITSKDQWSGDDLQRVITVIGRRGIHTITVSHFTKEIVSTSYKHFPNADIQALVYPIYEETEDLKLQSRIPVTLKNISNLRKQIIGDPLSALRERRYFYSKYDPFLDMTEEGNAQSWSIPWLLFKARSLFHALPWEDNSYENNGVLLEGKYVTVGLHPAVAQIEGVKVPLRHSGQMSFAFAEAIVNGKRDYEIIPLSTYRGLPLTDEKSALNRPAVRLSDHNVVEYINSGFDEVQVYYATDVLMESLHQKGFDDPEISTRPFHAILFDNDIEMRDNAYYIGDTINFTTYSPEAPNYARDNTTIWHELGHGVMDRLMGDHIVLADSGGLSEGMADFIAKIVIEDVTQGTAFEGKEKLRIQNQIGFHLTNESHDDGEAYGGAMNDILVAATQKYGIQNGIQKVTDLTLEAMRLARNHPALTANDWFERMLFADELGSSVRTPGELKQIILLPLLGRNFSFDNGPVAEFKIQVNGKGELTDTSLGSRYNPYIVQLKPDETATHQLRLSLKGSDTYQFKYPVRVELSYNGGPLQGPVRWINEEQGAQSYTLNNESEAVEVRVGVTGKCDSINQTDGGCSDFLYMKVFNEGEEYPSAKKRFYMRLKQN